MTAGEAANILGVSIETVEMWQANGRLPNPIPDDFLDTVIDFRLKIEQAFRRKYDQQRGVMSDEDRRDE
jgi:hypothetical protein